MSGTGGQLQPSFYIGSDHDTVHRKMHGVILVPFHGIGVEIGFLTARAHGGTLKDVPYL